MSSRLTNILGISPKWSEIPNKSLPRSDVVNRFRDFHNRNNNSSSSTTTSTSSPPLSSSASNVAMSAMRGVGTLGYSRGGRTIQTNKPPPGGILAAKLLSPMPTTTPSTMIVTATSSSASSTITGGVSQITGVVTSQQPQACMENRK